MTSCPHCSAQLDPEREHHCPHTRDAKVTREEFEKLRGAVTSLMTWIRDRRTAKWIAERLKLASAGKTRGK